MGVYIGYQAVPRATYEVLATLPDAVLDTVIECITDGSGIFEPDTFGDRVRDGALAQEAANEINAVLQAAWSEHPTIHEQYVALNKSIEYIEPVLEQAAVRHALPNAEVVVQGVLFGIGADRDALSRAANWLSSLDREELLRDMGASHPELDSDSLADLGDELEDLIACYVAASLSDYVVLVHVSA